MFYLHSKYSCIYLVYIIEYIVYLQTYMRFNILDILITAKHKKEGLYD